MLKKTCLPLLLLLGFWACATFVPPPPVLYLENPPASLVAELSLDERIAIEEAWNYLRRGKANKAEKIFIRLGSQSFFYNVGLGYSTLLLSDFWAAEGYFKEALIDDPDLILAHAGLAQVYQKTGREELAFNEYAEVLKREPENDWANKEFELLRTKKTEECLAEAKMYLEQGNTEKSKEAYLKALHYFPKSQEAHLALARIYKKDNNLPNALLHLKAAFSHEPKNSDVLKNYADTLFEAGQYARSLDFYERLLELNPQNKLIKDRVEDLKNRLGIIELPSQYNLIPTSTAITKEEAAALIGIKFKEFLDELPSKPPVIIDISTSWASKFIIKAAALEIMDVYSNHTFQPKKMVTKAEMAEILLRLIQHLKKKGYKIIQQIPMEKIQILDVAPDNYYFQPIAQILSYQIMDLSQDRTFQPEAGFSGQEATKALNILLGLIK